MPCGSEWIDLEAGLELVRSLLHDPPGGIHGKKQDPTPEAFRNDLFPLEPQFERQLDGLTYQGTARAAGEEWVDGTSQATYLLETNICIYIINRQPMEVFDRFKGLKVGQVAVSSITGAELSFGVEKSWRASPGKSSGVEV